eukprot:TRINITY_DN34301_c0_g2_i1.p1 TRINITY_DN34301_c0_g2~~TRINITY_DN34301_c0_g2_i1.p1  ORF type:complete len:561 (+),score=26.20 TRINITY_DN34301_c0_g2_i1:129-1811(+)
MVSAIEEDLVPAVGAYGRLSNRRRIMRARLRFVPPQVWLQRANIATDRISDRVFEQVYLTLPSAAKRDRYEVSQLKPRPWKTSRSCVENSHALEIPKGNFEVYSDDELWLERPPVLNGAIGKKATLRMKDMRQDRLDIKTQRQQEEEWLDIAARPPRKPSSGRICSRCFDQMKADLEANFASVAGATADGGPSNVDCGRSFDGNNRSRQRLRYPPWVYFAICPHRKPKARLPKPPHGMLALARTVTKKWRFSHLARVRRGELPRNKKLTRFCEHGLRAHSCVQCSGCKHGRLIQRCVTCRPCPHGRVKRSCAVCAPCPHGKVRDHCRQCSSCQHGALRSACLQCSGCEHGRLRSACVECRGCVHGSLTWNCVACRGCPHGRLKSFCRECSACEHGRPRWNCGICRGCPHGLLRRFCTLCAPCPHGRQRHKCSEVGCAGCHHGRLKTECRKCNGCVHGRARRLCVICNPCPHGKRKQTCLVCSACPHGRRRDSCAQCKACPHGKVPRFCKICRGCPHGLLPRFCAHCSGSIDRTTAAHASAAKANVAVVAKEEVHAGVNVQ